MEIFILSWQKTNESILHVYHCLLFFSEFTETYLLACLVDYFDNTPDFKRLVMLDLVCSVQMYVVQDDQLVLKESA